MPVKALPKTSWKIFDTMRRAAPGVAGAALACVQYRTGASPNSASNLLIAA